MKYGELISFEPIDSVKVLREADDLAAARVDVETLVVSPRLAEQLTDVILPNLNLDEPRDAKGILVVANYGTGKTHLMSVVSSIAEHPELVDVLNSEAVRAAAAPVAGRYKVIRAEIGATQMSLRDIITTELSEGLQRLGVDFEFPDLTKVTGTKKNLEEMMQAFERVHGEQGLLFVLDEMLDYLAVAARRRASRRPRIPARDRRDLQIDPVPLHRRCAGGDLRQPAFRWRGGHDPPGPGAFRAGAHRQGGRRLRRAGAPARKNATQRAKIREHLRAFTPPTRGWPSASTSSSRCSRCTPTICEPSTATWSRSARCSRTVCDEMRRVLDTDVPTDAPGLICSDSYRAQLAADPSPGRSPRCRGAGQERRAAGKVAERAAPRSSTSTLRCGSSTASPFTGSPPRTSTARSADNHESCATSCACCRPGLPSATRCSSRRPSTRSSARILTAVSGQFLPSTTENGQIYLDVRKDIDYDQQIDQRADSLDERQARRGVLPALWSRCSSSGTTPTLPATGSGSTTCRGRRRTPTGPATCSWARPTSAPRPSRRGTSTSTSSSPTTRPVHRRGEARRGLLPPRQPDEEFTRALRRYAGAWPWSKESTGQHRPVYAEKRQRPSRRWWHG